MNGVHVIEEFSDSPVTGSDSRTNSLEESEPNPSLQGNIVYDDDLKIYLIDDGDTGNSDVPFLDVLTREHKSPSLGRDKQFHTATL